MELNLVKVTFDQLDSAARCVLALKEQPFFFIRMQNTLYMNKDMKGIRKITAAVETMWKYDCILPYCRFCPGSGLAVTCQLSAHPRSGPQFPEFHTFSRRFSVTPAGVLCPQKPRSHSSFQISRSS